MIGAEEIYKEAHQAGMSASEHIPDVGSCGFAWVRIKPASGKFVSYLKANRIGYPNLGGGYEVMADCRQQALDAHEAYIRAFAAVLQSHGIAASLHSRLD